MLRGMRHIIGRRAVVALAALLMVVSLVAIPLPQTTAWWQGEVEAAPPEQTPPGQLKRRGIVGRVKSISTSTSTPIVIDDKSATSTTPVPIGPDTVMTVETDFGDVNVIITEDTRIRAPLQGDVDLNTTIGSKVAILLAKGSSTPSEDGSPVLRTATALKVMIVPDRAIRTHARAIVKAKLSDRLQIVGEDGELVEIEDPETTDLEEGDDLIVVTQKKDHPRVRTAKFVVRGLKGAIHISERLERITDRLIAESDAPRLEKLKGRIVAFQERQEKRLAHVEQRLSDIRQGDDSSLISLPQIQDTPSDGKPNDAKNRRQRLANILNRIDKATEGQNTDTSLKQNEEKKLQRIKAIRAEAKERVKERLQQVREKHKVVRDDNGGENQARKLISRIVDAVTDESAVEAHNEIGGEIDEDEQDSNSNPLLRERIKNQVKREVKRRLQDRSEDCALEDLDGDGIAEECPEEGNGSNDRRPDQQDQKEKQERRGNGRK